MRALVKLPKVELKSRNAQAVVEQKKLVSEYQEQRLWWLKLLTPYVTLAVTGLGLAMTWVHERDADRRQMDLERDRSRAERESSQQQAERFIEQLNQNRTIADEARQQEERHHDEETFTQAIGHLNADGGPGRVGAIYEVGMFARRPSFRERALSALAANLSRPADVEAERAIYEVFREAGGSGIEFLLKANKLAQNDLSRSYGAYVGLEMAHKYPEGPNPYLGNAEESKRKEQERFFIIGDPVTTVAARRRPIEEDLSNDFVRDTFWVQQYPSVHNEIYRSSMNGAWTYPAEDFDNAKKERLDTLAKDVHFLELTSSLLEEAVKRESGQLSRYPLSGVYFVVPGFSGVDFRGADVSNSYFIMADLRKSNFSHSNCSFANFDGANFADAEFVGAVFRGANLEANEPFLAKVNGRLAYSYPSFSVREDQRFDGADFRDSSWRSAERISPAMREYLEKRYSGTGRNVPQP